MNWPTGQLSLLHVTLTASCRAFKRIKASPRRHSPVGVQQRVVWFCVSRLFSIVSCIPPPPAPPPPFSINTPAWPFAWRRGAITSSSRIGVKHTLMFFAVSCNWFTANHTPMCLLVSVNNSEKLGKWHSYIDNRPIARLASLHNASRTVIFYSFIFTQFPRLCCVVTHTPIQWLVRCFAKWRVVNCRDTQRICLVLEKKGGR